MSRVARSTWLLSFLFAGCLAEVQSTSDLEGESAELEDDGEVLESPATLTRPTAPVPARAPITNAFLLTQESVVITVQFGVGPSYFSDIGRTQATRPEDVSPSGTLGEHHPITAAEPLRVRVGQRVEFCNASDRLVQMHASPVSAFAHWRRPIQPGTCTHGQDDLPKVILQSAVGNPPGNSLYDHIQGPGPAKLYLQVEAAIGGS